MNYGLQLSASGVLTSLYDMDVSANNLANIETVGFKPDMVLKRVREAARQEDNLYHLPSDELLEKLGGGVQLMPNRISFSQGDVDVTNRDLDVALEGEGFFVLSDPSRGSTDGDQIRLSRDGRFSIAPDGRLVNSDGLHVLDIFDQPIRLEPDQTVQISSAGELTQGGEFVAQLQTTNVTDLQGIERIGGGLFKPSSAGVAGRTPADALVRQGALERSLVDPINALMGVTNAARGASSNSRMIQLHDEVLDLAVNRLGRIG